MNKGMFTYYRFYFLTCIEGKGRVDDVVVKPGTTILIPVGYGEIEIEGKITLLLSSYRD
jgi:mannose-6-phosphate isomerase class I